MYKWSAFPFIRVAICLISGILLFEAFPGLWEGYIYTISVLCSMTLIAWIFLRNQLIYGVICLVFISYLGGVLTLLNDDSLHPRHYTAYPHVDGFIGMVVSDHSEKKTYYRYDLKLIGGRRDSIQMPLSGMIYLYVKKGNNGYLRYGDIVVVSKSYFPVSGPKNPHAFDYQSYLKKQNIFSHAFVSEDQVRLLDSTPPNPLLALAYRVRDHSRILLEECIRYERERGILIALLLGIKDHLDNELKSAYAAAGAMHVLAVSGLHVGIVYYVLLVFLKGLKEWRWGRLLFVLISLSMIWIYALVTGFSPSVMRAVTMFSVIIISDAFNRKANIYNSLGIAACILIAYDPFLIYSVGFQLSFLAVFGIVMVYPRLYRLREFENKVADYIWSVTCVSIAAQLATFPLSLFYFHQFPTYSLLANVIVIPGATVMLIVGMSMLFIGSISLIAGKAIGFIFEDIIWLINELISLFQKLPYPTFDWLYFDLPQVILIYMAMILLFTGLTRFSFQHLLLSAIAFMAFFGWAHRTAFQQLDQQRMVCYDLGKITGIDLIDGRDARLLLSDFSFSHQELIDYQVNPHRLASGLDKAEETVGFFRESQLVTHHGPIDLIVWKGIRLAIVHDLDGFQLRQPLLADILFINGNLEPQILPVDAGQIILGSTLGYNETKEWRSLLAERKISVHSLSQDGFWELDLNKTKTFKDEAYTVFRN